MTDTQLILIEIRRLRELIDERLPAKAEQSKATRASGRNKYGEFGHVLLTTEEHAKLTERWGAECLAIGIKVLDEYIDKYGAKYKNHYNMLNKHWPAERMDEWLSFRERDKQKRTIWSE